MIEADHTGLPKPPDQLPLDINVKAVVGGIWLYRYLAARRHDGYMGGNMTVMASSAGLYPAEGLPVYSASKHAVVGLVRSAAKGLKKEGVRLDAICPGLVETALMPREVLEVWSKEHLTPIATVIWAHDALIVQDDKT
ncbi:uncharacterized protein HMPREF1541_05355 [Cyphellophora europaea CBS 101466]|uniref:SDR family NAD(P)-dependent oxidoreductase n=1 Tax=Cyphellophora europaea (strain CBS 101466) TaxID=1220924 RepID=W2RRN7_CYPE1|nr:uncharacterized protein HMPREF1541_05355 [Cyphellophora europaea CBS 101466]ETN39132.1 hypothetical protein HMPREF1541_05355 [Cyphellophora europaea CBS 101466]